MGSATLKICLRLLDETPFGGQAAVGLLTEQGLETLSENIQLEGEILFPNLLPGTYKIRASAPGFVHVEQTVKIEPGNPFHTLFLIMKPELLIDPPSRPDPIVSANEPATNEKLLGPPTTSPVLPPPGGSRWIPQSVDAAIPRVAPGVPCSLPLLLQGAGQHVTQLFTNLQKFGATERVEHFRLDATGTRHKPQSRTFYYVVLASPSSEGAFALVEYRNGTTDPALFPERTATDGLPAMAFIFHPFLVPDFDFACEGLGQWNGRPAWQIHFAQRVDRPNHIRSYLIEARYYYIPLKGRAWIDAGTFQVLRFESELSKPVQEIGLTQEQLAIDYGPVQFQSQKQQIWLPLRAEVYAERHGHRYYRRHTFSDFKLFTVGTSQQIQPPKQSYSFTNTTEHDIVGTLTVFPLAGISLTPVSVQFTIPPGGSVFKIVGVGKDVGIPPEQVASATFVHNGPAGSIRADAFLVTESTLDVIPETAVSQSP
ncbi:MAG: hypothetical protein ACRD59_13720 [Candidatus Acidiferrales bacterium]